MIWYSGGYLPPVPSPLPPNQKKGADMRIQDVQRQRRNACGDHQRLRQSIHSHHLPKTGRHLRRHQRLYHSRRMLSFIRWRTIRSRVKQILSKHWQIIRQGNWVRWSPSVRVNHANHLGRVWKHPNSRVSRAGRYNQQPSAVIGTPMRERGERKELRV